MEVNFDEALLEGLRVDPSYNEDILHQVLRIAVYDEYHAFNAYKKIIDTFGDMKPFSNIMAAEVKHYSALIPLLEKYNVPVPIDNWYEKIEIPDTILECCEVGVAAEIDNIKMYDNLLLYCNDYPDITDVLYRLQAASYNNHLPTFRSCVQQYSATPINVADIYNEYSTHDTGEDMMEKVNEFSALAQKVSTGQMSQEDIMKLLGNTNMSFIGGILLGGIGAQLVTSMLKNNKEKTEEEK
jgi:hypothetical protein